MDVRGGTILLALQFVTPHIDPLSTWTSVWSSFIIRLLIYPSKISLYAALPHYAVRFILEFNQGTSPRTTFLLLEANMLKHRIRI